MNGITSDRALRAGSRLRSLAQRLSPRHGQPVPAAAPAAPRRRLRTVHLSVLDGRTLNVCVEVPDARRGRPVVLEFVQDQAVVPVPMTVTASPYGPPRAEAAALLSLPGESGPAALGRVVLEPGRWRLRVALAGPVGQVEHADVGAAPELLGTGPTRPDPPSPETAHQARVDATKDGRALLRIGEVAPCAEVTRVDLGWTAVTVSGRPVGVPEGDLPLLQAEAVRRDTGGSERIPLLWDGARFTFPLPLDRMADPDGRELIWDVRLRCGERPLRLGRRLTDVRDPKQVFRTPYRLLVAEDGRTVRAHAYYTAGGSLCLSCVALGTE
ncbi:hypothetical protein LO771_06520 [Streptacidiphilus sp. ASG 303]|uniref:hypothetical protein n=1 Tax=Streptacidiphilus sp. ASG 303 TaxID=2896847 RepID=UPI001E53CB76|nr:hypothetical protein [Streptacidiphilus sp. ASG 303]MCD0482078.1 hypothetical protein [Streptacidiphilus sp. ASG 303]